MTDRTLEAIKCARINRTNGIVHNEDDVIGELATEIDRLAFELHCLEAHPDFEYATTKTARKSGDDPRIGLKGEGWEPNDIVPIYDHAEGVVEQRWRNWERHEFHEDNYWRRRKA